MEDKMDKRIDLQNKVIAKAMEDPSFKKALMEDPAGAIASEFGIRVPEGIEIEVVQETAKKVYLVLPSATDKGVGERAAAEDAVWT